MSKKSPTILVTGVGALIGYGIIKSLRQGRHTQRIISMDIYDDAYGRFLSDDFVKAVPAQSAGYAEFIRRTVDQHHIDLIIPGIEQDLYALWEMRGEMEGAKLVMNNDLLIGLSRNKWSAFRYFQEKGVNVIPTLSDVGFQECADRLSLPFLIKPMSSYASKGIHTVSSEEEFRFYSGKLENRCIYQRIVGSISSEFTIAVFGDGKGGFFDSIVLIRELSKEGATSKAELVLGDEVIDGYVRQLCELTRPVGPTNIQLRKEGDRPFLLEINPRISSACSIRTCMGYNEPDMCVDYFVRDQPPVVQSRVSAKVVRYIDDYVRYE